MQPQIYLDNHSTTRCDVRVVTEMLPWLTETYGNPHSRSHRMGQIAKDAIDVAIQQILQQMGAEDASLIYTSGATESNNLAIKGVCFHPRQKRRTIVTVKTEHPSVLDVCHDLRRHGFQVISVPVEQTPGANQGVIDLEALSRAVNDDTALVSVMWANNEIGAIAPMAEVAAICHARGALVHCDATQAIGRIAVDMRTTDVDLLSAAAHKFHGPKGIGFLVVRSTDRRVRLLPQIVGGGQQMGLRSGTLAPANIVGMSKALGLATNERDEHVRHIRSLRDHFAELLFRNLEDLRLNGPDLSSDHRLPGNLNLSLDRIEGEAWVIATPEVAFSSGSACSHVDATSSHVIQALGQSESEARRSARFGLSRFTTREEIERAAEALIASYKRLTRA